MARGSTWMKVKREKLRKQLRALPRTPLTHQTIAQANAERDAVNTLVAYTFTGAVVHGQPGKHEPAQGKAGRRLNTRTYGNFKHAPRCLLTPDVFDTRDGVLLRNGVEVK